MELLVSSCQQHHLHSFWNFNFQVSFFEVPVEFWSDAGATARLEACWLGPRCPQAPLGVRCLRRDICLRLPRRLLPGLRPSRAAPTPLMPRRIQITRIPFSLAGLRRSLRLFPRCAPRGSGRLPALSKLPDPLMRSGIGFPPLIPQAAPRRALSWKPLGKSPTGLSFYGELPLPRASSHGSGG